MSHTRRTASTYLITSLSASLMLGLASSVSAMQSLIGQSVAHSSDQTVSLPSPLMSAGFPDPTQPIDWQHYQLPEGCGAVFERARAVAKYVQRQNTSGTARDTIHNDPFIPIPPAAIQATRPCVRRFPAVALPAFAWSRMLSVAIATNADADIQAIVAQQLAATHDTTARAEALLTVIQALMTDPITAAHTQLARLYTARLDTIGAEAILERLSAREALMRPAEITHDLDAQLATAREKLQLIQQPQFASLPVLNKILGRLPTGQIVTTKDERMYAYENEMRRLTYLKTLSLNDLTQLIAPIKAFLEKLGASSMLLGESAPPVHCDYYFPASTASKAISQPLTPARGTLSLLLFWQGNQVTQELTSMFHRLRQIPELSVTVVATTRGTFAGRLLLEHPEQEAELLHGYLSDTLGVPGAVCVDKTVFRSAPDGRAIPSADPNQEAYRNREGDLGWIIVDRTGLVVYERGNIQIVSNEDLMWYLQRLAAKSAKKESVPSAIPNDQTPIAPHVQH